MSDPNPYDLGHLPPRMARSVLNVIEHNYRIKLEMLDEVFKEIERFAPETHSIEFLTIRLRAIQEHLTSERDKVNERLAQYR